MDPVTVQLECTMAKPDERLINVPTAKAIAAQRGAQVKANTILMAARRGTIQEAEKQGGRWVFPAWAFDDWLLTHMQRSDYAPASKDRD